MPRRKLRLNYGEARDSDGVIHIPQRPGLWMKAACNGRPIGTNEEGLYGYCSVCFPEHNKKIRTCVGEFSIKPEYIVEEIETNSWELPKSERKPKSTKTLDEILRKTTFTRRKLS